MSVLGFKSSRVAGVSTSWGAGQDLCDCSESLRQYRGVMEMSQGFELLQCLAILPGLVCIWKWAVELLDGKSLCVFTVRAGSVCCFGARAHGVGLASRKASTSGTMRIAVPLHPELRFCSKPLHISTAKRHVVAHVVQALLKLTSGREASVHVDYVAVRMLSIYTRFLAPLHEVCGFWITLFLHGFARMVQGEGMFRSQH